MGTHLRPSLMFWVWFGPSSISLTYLQKFSRHGNFWCLIGIGVWRERKGDEQGDGRDSFNSSVAVRFNLWPFHSTSPLCLLCTPWHWFAPSSHFCFHFVIWRLFTTWIFLKKRCLILSFIFVEELIMGVEGFSILVWRTLVMWPFFELFVSLGLIHGFSRILFYFWFYFTSPPYGFSFYMFCFLSF